MSILAIASSLILLFAAKGDGAPETMSPELWRSIAKDYVGAATVAEARTLPTAADCRAKGAAFAVLATFDHIAVLPGGAPRDPDRAYAVAHFAVRNCIEGSDLPVKAVPLQSEPLETALLDNDPLGARVWARPVRGKLAHTPLHLTLDQARVAAAAAQGAPVGGGTVTRVGRIVGPNDVLLEFDPALQQGQTLRVVTAPGAPANETLLVVQVIAPRGIRATVVRGSTATLKVGDILAPTP